MSNENESKDLKLEDLEKPLTEVEMKETTGGTETIVIVNGVKKLNRGRGGN